MSLINPLVERLTSELAKSLLSGSLLDITDIVVFGASIMEQSFSDTSDTESKWLDSGAIVDVHERATSGDDTAQMITRLPAIITEFQANADKTLFVIHWGGNDVSRDGPYPGGAATMEANMRSMLDDIKAAGFKIMMSDISYRIPPASNPAQPYNDAFMYQLQSEYNDIDWFLYQFVFDNQANLEPDGIHPDPVLENLIRQYHVDSAAPFIIKTAEDTNVVTDLVVEFGNETLMTRDSGSNAIGGNLTITDLRNSDYSKIVGSSLSLSGATSINTVGRGNTADPTNTTVSLFNNDCLTDSMFASSGNTMTVDLSGLPLEDTALYTVGITASRADTSGTKVTDYTVDGSTLSLDAELTPPGQVYFNSVAGASLKSSGVQATAQVGSSFGYISILQITKE